MARRAKRTTHAALLRGINVGGKNRLQMKPLAQLFADAGCDPVRTYIQSGNVVFGAERAAMRTLAADISAAIERDHGLRVPLIMRTLEQLREVRAGFPFDPQRVEPKHLYVAFLRDKPSATQLAALDPERSPPDTFVTGTQHLYICFPSGSGRSKLDAPYIDRTLGTISTWRNLRTLEKVIALGDAIEAELAS
ncbi:MAG: DUF1697 domain-containing protein [Myxococcales bacterium]|nr:DUF1697 domain-containing protein [Myxococcales bacterium]